MAEPRTATRGPAAGPSARASAGWLLLATTLWGTSSATLAQAGGAPAAAPPVVAAGGALMLLLATAVAGRSPLRLLAAHWRMALIVGAFEAANLSLYLLALRTGPLPLMVALHLTAPVLLVLWQVARRERAPSVLVATELALIAGAVWLVADAQPAGQATTDALRGAALSLGSAVVLAAQITVMARLAKRDSRPDAVFSAGSQLAVAAVLSSPLLFAGALPPAADSALLLGVGAALLAPGFALYWRALRGLRPAAASIIGLAEGVIAPLVGAVAFAAAIGGAAVAAAALVLLAVVIELRDPHHRQPVAPPTL